MITGEQAIEKALEAVRKAGWIYVWATSTEKKDGQWVVEVETITRKYNVTLDSEGNLIELKETKQA